ncbi:hypothetical protein AAFF_G00305580 [Aldrovandia affinis]|uniref:Uncharacterized protein n=1 Tax=Aldrovandia affinis TaxID=143900 RepID=A0AAD7SQL8_9TELE|nr:hypothetical protein AAFF_G00305580 [Aldrovandia affinis]
MAPTASRDELPAAVGPVTRERRPAYTTHAAHSVAMAPTASRGQALDSWLLTAPRCRLTAYIPACPGAGPHSPSSSSLSSGAAGFSPRISVSNYPERQSPLGAIAGCKYKRGAARGTATRRPWLIRSASPPARREGEEVPPGSIEPRGERRVERRSRAAMVSGRIFRAPVSPGAGGDRRD